jgi:hypothetical protein
MVCHQMTMLSELHLQHSWMHQSQSRMVFVDSVRSILELRISDASDHQMLILFLSPMQNFPFHRP